MVVFDPNIFDPNIFDVPLPTGGTATSLGEFLRRRSKGRSSRGFVFRDVSFEQPVVTMLKPVSYSVRRETITVKREEYEKMVMEAKAEALMKQYENLPPEELIARAKKELIEAAKLDDSGELLDVLDGMDDEEDDDDSFLHLIEHDMLQEEFRQDVIKTSIKGSIDDAVKSAWLGNFKDLNREQSQYVRDILQDAFSNNASHSATIARLQRFVDIPYEQAKTIVDTEFQQIRNRALMLAYKETETEDSRYIWDTKRDYHVCEICDTIKHATLPGGVTMNELLDIIKEAQYQFGADTARRYIAHVGDRCRIARIR